MRCYHGLPPSREPSTSANPPRSFSKLQVADAARAVWPVRLVPVHPISLEVYAVIAARTHDHLKVEDVEHDTASIADEVQSDVYTHLDQCACALFSGPLYRGYRM